jgi:hypothetical protein
MISQNLIRRAGCPRYARVRVSHRYVFALIITLKLDPMIKSAKTIVAVNDYHLFLILGCILYEVYHGKPPFFTNNVFHLIKMIGKGIILFNPFLFKTIESFRICQMAKTN